MPTSAPRTLADQFRSWPDERLSALLEARPDLGTPAPHDSSQLAARVVVKASRNGKPAKKKRSRANA